MPSVKSGLKKLTAEGRKEQKKMLDETGMTLQGDKELFELTHGTFNDVNSFHRKFAAWSAKRSLLSLGDNFCGSFSPTEKKFTFFRYRCINYVRS